MYACLAGAANAGTQIAGLKIALASACSLLASPAGRTSDIEPQGPASERPHASEPVAGLSARTSFDCTVNPHHFIRCDVGWTLQHLMQIRPPHPAVAARILLSKGQVILLRSQQLSSMPADRFVCSIPAGAGSLEVRRMVTQFKAWLSEYITKHGTASHEGTAILEHLLQVW